ncbi:MAG TPA: DNA repair protein RecN [Candidatus Excrementavichristensenella intestinipullorum]|nr:DNA repair protein RecN [Candidatus Excrementavichristensenella intestinipullorum]
MLLEIAIANIALIDRLRLELGPGLNVLTGETGAGKSILVDALTLVLGGRADKSLIRTGASRARVEALFDITGNQEAQALLEAWGLESDQGIAVLARELSEGGRSLCRVCGATVPLNQFKRLAGALVELHGQHEHQLLCDPERHTAYLDGFGGAEHRALVDKAAADYAQYAALGQEMARLKKDLAEGERLRDMLSFQLEEIDAVKPKAGEMAALERKNVLMRSAQKVAQRLNRACDLVYRGGGRGPSAQEALQKAAQAVADIGELDPRFQQAAARLEELFYAAQDLGYELEDMCESMDFDPGEAQRVAGRLSELKGLTRKYGPELEDVLAFRAQTAARLEEIQGGDERLDQVQGRLDKAREALERSCQALGESRRALSGTLCRKIMDQLKDLGMDKARFEVRFNSLPQKYGPAGAEKAEFMLSANPGEPVKPLSAVASGGELSRIMLAMKAVAADQAGVDAMVFDEIDTGVSGRMAQAVGEKMAAIARRRQVICVSHLPQIAALADRQYLVEKKVEDGRTGSTVRLLDRAGRIEELARMVGGAGDMESSRAHGANLLDAAQALRASMEG